MNTPNVEQICKLLKIGKATYYRYKKSDEPILKLINYFSKEELEELIVNGKIGRLESKDNLINNNDLEYEILINNTKYQLKPKIYLLFSGTITEKIYTFISKNILIRTLEKLSNENKTHSIKNAKKFLINELERGTVKFYESQKLKVLISIIEENLSDLECYTLIKYSEEIFDYKYKNYYFKLF